MNAHPMQLYPARILAVQEENPGVLTYRLRFDDRAAADAFAFAGGQFNMLYVHGVGEVPISIMSDPDDAHELDHTIRIVGRVTRAIEKLAAGDTIGLRGPYGRGWPLLDAKGQEILVVTGGLGCAPVVGAIEYLFRRRDEYGTIRIMHGVKTARDLLYRERFEHWREHPDTEVLLASDEPDRDWHNHVGVVTELFDRVTLDPERTIVMMCGPEMMMKLAAQHLLRRGIAPERIHLSMERNMQCGIGLCGHCQLGPYFVCRDGPVMRYDEVGAYLGKEG